MDVLLINPGSLKAVYQDLANVFSAIEPPSMAAIFATYLRNKGLTVDILDAPAFSLVANSVAEIVTHYYRPKLVVLAVYGFQPSASTQNMPAAGEISRAIKQMNSKIPILMTGTHPAALPARTMDEEAIDFVCDREGPQTILETVRVLKQGGSDFGNVPDLWWRHNGGVVSNPHGPLMEDLDKEMPGAAWDLLPMDRYRCHNWHAFDHIHNRMPYASIHTTLGCPFKCSFCCINAPFGKSSYRKWSPQHVAKEIDILVRDYGVKNIKFVDEMFVLHKEHVLGLCDLLIERNYDLNIWAYARIDTIKDEYLVKLRKAGIRWLALGIESGSKHVRDGVEKGKFGTNDIIQIVRKVQDHGMYVIGNYIFGLPDDDMQSMQQTLDLAIEANCEFANFYSAMAYPGSKLYNVATQRGWELPSSWIAYSQHSFEALPLRTEHLTSAQVLRFRDEAFTKYFAGKAYLDLVERKFGLDVQNHITAMASIQLKRNLYS
ncbi:MAG: cobalamin B12-binding domain-containing protein [Deltaproteobacteria bacterium]|nr:cobalamin B12-binding domain-containing protein [Deltaproteobacteria bacterium]